MFLMGTHDEGASVCPTKMLAVAESDSARDVPVPDAITAQHVDHPLHDANVVEHRNRGREEKRDQEHANGKDKRIPKT